MVIFFLAARQSHDLRHTFTSWIVQRGRSLYEVSKALRHSSLKPTERYAHLELEHLRDTHGEVGDVPVNFAVDEQVNLSEKKQWQEALKRKQHMHTKSRSAHSSHIDLKLVK